jgi:hypothetical protein
MLNAPPKRRHSPAHVARMARHINDGVELHPSERSKAVRLVSVYKDKASACRDRSSNTSCGAGDVMARCESMGGNCTPQKLRTAKDQ